MTKLVIIVGIGGYYNNKGLIHGRGSRKECPIQRGLRKILRKKEKI